MDDKKLQEYVDQQRWLMNNGLISDNVKNQLFFCGSIVHKDVQGVELTIRTEDHCVDYQIYVPSDVIKKMAKYKELSTSTSLFGMWRFKRFLKKEGSLDFHSILSKFVNDFLGSQWSATVEVKDFAEYVDSLGEESGSPGEPSQQPN